VDYNRSGVPLLEIVTEPDLHSLEDIKAYATELRSVLRTLGVNSGDMEKGVMRFEANISLRRAGAPHLGTRTEIKNLNSFRSMLRAVDYEIGRQARLLTGGQPVLQETVGWNEATGETFSQRGKEEAHDYRYFQEPDLPPLLLEPGLVDRVQASLPELPSERRLRWRSQYGLTPALAGVLSAEPAHAAYFEAAVEAAGPLPPERIAHWLVGELFGLLNAAGVQLASCPIRPAHLADLVGRVEAGTLTVSNAKSVLSEMFSGGESPEPIIARRGLSVVDDAQAVRRLVDQVLASHPEQVAEYQAGKASLEQWLFGQVMRLAGGRAHPASVRQSLREALSSPENRQPGL
jgi:aspartyl-tRNA(Asn)/glutamyl-tRNA(Gln) amidotransferase subunit B